MSAFYNVAPENKLRVIAPDVGGGFGSKIYIYPGRDRLPVGVEEDRRAGQMGGRPHRELPDRRAWPRPSSPQCEMAFDKDNKILGLKVDTIANLGAYMSLFSSSVPTYLYATLLSGQYDIPAIHANVRAVYTNTAPVDAYRGAGRPEATFVIERIDGDGGARARRVAGRAAPQELHHARSRTRRRSS